MIKLVDICAHQAKIIGGLPCFLQLPASSFTPRHSSGNPMQIASSHQQHGVQSNAASQTIHSSLPMQLSSTLMSSSSCAWRWSNSLVLSAPRHAIGVWHHSTPVTCRALALPTPPADKHSQLHDESPLQSNYQLLRPFEQTSSFSSSTAGTADAAVSGPTRVVVMAVDPDTHGAIAVVSWDTQDTGAVVDPQTVKMNLYDMPCAQVILQKKSKVTGLNARRRWLDINGAKAVIQSVLDELRQNTTAGQVNVELRAFVESAPVMPFTSRPSTIAPQLHSIGAWHGMLSLAGFKTCTVPAMTWKKDLSLVGLDKEGSLVLAQKLWPQHAHMLQRKKDHGRAEAMLIAAWAIGASRPAPPDANPADALPKKRRNSKTSKANDATNGNGYIGKEGVLKSIMMARAGLLTDCSNHNHNQNPNSSDDVSGSQATSDGVHPINDIHNGNGIDPGEAKFVESLRLSKSVETKTDTGQSFSSESVTMQAHIEQAEASVRHTSSIEKAQVQRLIQVRGSWTVVLGSLRDVKPTDGYGNPFPEGLNEAINLEAQDVEEDGDGDAVAKALTTKRRKPKTVAAMSVTPAPTSKAAKRRAGASNKNTASESKQDVATSTEQQPSSPVPTKTKQRKRQKGKTAGSD